ncbi:hypothetical protein ACCO45_012305 [Purpureocillium lilacinum]|uniref:Uncharacterized protein n=1 Tax=Purpureocillium lilacinum TaxID=33203 RepID=A0ACC4D8E6_PURLI
MVEERRLGKPFGKNEWLLAPWFRRKANGQSAVVKTGFAEYEPRKVFAFAVGVTIDRGSDSAVGWPVDPVPIYEPLTPPCGAEYREELCFIPEEDTSGSLRAASSFGDTVQQHSDWQNHHRRWSTLRIGGWPEGWIGAATFWGGAVAEHPSPRDRCWAEGGAEHPSPRDRCWAGDGAEHPSPRDRCWAGDGAEHPSPRDRCWAEGGAEHPSPRDRCWAEGAVQSIRPTGQMLGGAVAEGSTSNGRLPGPPLRL